MWSEHADNVVASPSSVDHLGSQLAMLIEQLSVAGPDSTLLTAEAIGHAALADALLDFVALTESDAQELRTQLEETIAEARRCALNYADVDSGNAGRFNDLGTEIAG